ncbi:MAG: sugar phosphate isomerase/epimerase family protein [Lactovum sp.]
MKIGIRPHDLEFENIQELCDKCKEIQAEGLQLVWMRIFPDKINDLDFINDQMKIIQENDIDVYLLGSYFNMIHPDKEKLELGHEIFKANTRIAKANNIKNIGSETGSVNGEAWTYHPDNHTEESYTKLKEAISRVTENLDEEKYLLEPVYDHVSYNLEITKSMMLNDKVAITLDLANLLNIDNHQDYLEIFESFLKEFGSRIKILHFKNFIFEKDQKKLCQLDKGLMDYKKIYPLVEKYGLTNLPIIIEEIQDEELIESIKFIRSFEKK